MCTFALGECDLPFQFSASQLQPHQITASVCYSILALELKHQPTSHSGKTISPYRTRRAAVGGRVWWGFGLIAQTSWSQKGPDERENRRSHILIWILTVWGQCWTTKTRKAVVASYSLFIRLSCSTLLSHVSSPAAKQEQQKCKNIRKWGISSLLDGLCVIINKARLWSWSRI